jgi:large subunit ribosomal protein L15
MALKSGTDRALALIRTLPRVALNNVKADPDPNIAKRERGRGQHGGKRQHLGQKGGKQRMTYTRLGYEGGQTPFYLRIPMEPYYKNHHLKRQYPPISLQQLQLLIDTNRINTDYPIDLCAICNTKIFDISPHERQYGFNLTDKGIDNFKAKVNIEVQWTTEAVIAAVEKNGGTITTAYYDMDSLFAAKNPELFFKKGHPIPKRLLPPEDGIEYYSDPKFRGYLADPDLIAEERLVLAQKYGYVLPDLNADPAKELLLMRKDPRQVFHGLQPGWVVNLRDKRILKPTAEYLKEYYEC